MSTTSDLATRRKADLEAKRAKLLELRQAREARSSQLSSAAPSRPSSTLGLGTSNSSALSNSGSGSTRADVDELLSSFNNNGSSRNESPLSNRDSGLDGMGIGSSSIASRSIAGGEMSGRTSRASRASEDPSLIGAGSERAIASESGNIPPVMVTFSTSTDPIEPAVKEKVVYEKGIQTGEDLWSRRNSAHQDETADGANGLAGGAGKETAEEMRSRILAELEEERLKLDAEIEVEKKKAIVELEEERIRGLSNPELSSVLTSPPFLDFLSHSSKIVQRALSDSYDYLRDYTVSSTDTSGESDGAKVRLLGSWYEERWGKGRSVTGVDWSPKFPELFVASYNKNPMAVNEPDGIACVWNLHLLERPEFVFHAQSDVLSVSFTPFHPNLLIGGTYSGQILLWDTRSRHPNPVLKTPLSASGHTHPVYSLSMIGTQNAHNLISASTDGTVCAWTLDMLARPQETLELLHPSHNKTDEVSITALGFPEGETTTFWVGTEEGNVYPANRYDRAGAKAGLGQSEVYKGHSGPVTGMDFHPVAGNVDLSDLFLTSGVDWTVKLWRTGGATGTSSNQANSNAGGGGSGSTNTGGHSSGVISPLCSFEEADDYVYDVRWHPNHPAMFGSVDGAGKFDLWNLNVDTEVPIVSTLVAPNAPRGLNKLSWDKKEGRRAAIGSSDGRVYVYEISQELATPKENEWEMMRKTCNGLSVSENIAR